MATSKQFTDLMYDWLNTATRLINQKLVNVFDDTKEKVINSNPEMIELITKKNSLNLELVNLNNKIDLIKKELRNTDDEINKLDCPLDEDITNNINEQFLWTNIHSYSRMKSSHYEAMKLLIDSVELKNVLWMKKIYSHYVQLMALAIWTKEQREVLWKLYSINWSELWIDLPINRNIDSIEIKDWVINVWAKLLN